jgi:BirA family biotin operon repressor/biotin-[acetyl-CoA-carboxylase] ligase
MLAEEILYLLELNRGRVVSGGELAKSAGVSRTAVWKAVHSLIERGDEIEIYPNAGYKLSNTSDGLCARIISDALATRIFGRALEVFDSLPSTNRYIKENFSEDKPEGYAVIADRQTEGRGRKGRPFYSPPGNGVYVSVLLKPRLAIGETPFLTICAAAAVVSALEDVFGFRADIKWVNDIYFGGKKLSGILTEVSASAETRSAEYVVTGIGVNTGGVPPEVRDIATSTAEITGERGKRNKLAAAILNRFEETYLGLTERGEREKILETYRDRMFLTGRRVTVRDSDTVFSGAVTGVGDGGELLVRTDEGETRAVTAGEIHII